VMADIGLGKRLAVVVAKKLLSIDQTTADGEQRLDSITIRGTEGLAVQFAPCCRPIPGDPIIAQIKKGQGLLIHTHDCPAIHPFHFDPEKWVDVQWDSSADRFFDVNVRLIAQNSRGVLARLAAEVSEADSNIDHIETEQRTSPQYTTVVFTIQVKNRMHLAHVFRRLRRIPEVVRITRLKKKT
jgi:guanosine-3',5'-bis(diphosphate) 3'-pyrophosphohydrolase